ncbi:MAG: DUF1931 family protein [Marmoricola sp.]
MELQGIARFERFFRQAAGIDIDKSDVRRFDDFVNDRLHALLLRAVANARANGRDVVEPQDIPVTKGIQEAMHTFRDLDQDFELDPILEQLTRRPPLDLVYSDETRDELPYLAGGLGVALARTFAVIDDDLKSLQPRHWEKAGRVFDVLL